MTLTLGLQKERNMDEYGYVEDIELAKAILTMYFGSKFITETELLERIKSSLIYYDGGFTFNTPDGSYFGGPFGMSGYIIQTLESWLKENPKNQCSVFGQVSDLNEHELVFYELEGKLTCFVLSELD